MTRGTDIRSESKNIASENSGNLWRDVWHDVRHNPSAMGGLSVIIVLIAFCQLGGLFWKTAPSAMDITQISLPPAFGVQTRVIQEHISDNIAPTVVSFPPVTALQTLDAPTTESVKLVWPASSNAMNKSHSHYRIYRHELPPSGVRDLGMPLSETSEPFYEDQLRLEPRVYYYSILDITNPVSARDASALDGEQDGIPISTIKVNVALATPVSVLREQGLLQAGEPIPASFTLPAHPLGTDKLGRDLLARLITGGQVSLFVGIVAPLVFVFFGTLYGAIAGYIGGKTDTLMMAFADFIIALPFLLFMILLRMAFGLGAGDSGISALLFALIVLSWPNTARLVRGQVLQLRSTAYVDAARLQGASSVSIVWRHLMPNVLPSILVTLSFAIPSAIFTEAFLSFIGLGVVPPTPSWGSLCNDGLPGFLTHPHELLFPALFISLAVLAFNLLGDGLRDALDVQARERKGSTT